MKETQFNICMSYIRDITGLKYWHTSISTIEEPFIYSALTNGDLISVTDIFNDHKIVFEIYENDRVIIRLKNILSEIRNNKINSILND